MSADLCAGLFHSGGSFHIRGFEPILSLLLFVSALALHSRQLDLKLRLDFLWAVQVCKCPSVCVFDEICLNVCLLLGWSFISRGPYNLPLRNLMLSCCFSTHRRGRSTMPWSFRQSIAFNPTGNLVFPCSPRLKGLYWPLVVKMWLISHGYVFLMWVGSSVARRKRRGMGWRKSSWITGGFSSTFCQHTWPSTSSCPTPGTWWACRKGRQTWRVQQQAWGVQNGDMVLSFRTFTISPMRKLESSLLPSQTSTIFTSSWMATTWEWSAWDCWMRSLPTLMRCNTDRQKSAHCLQLSSETVFVRRLTCSPKGGFPEVHGIAHALNNRASKRNTGWNALLKLEKRCKKHFLAWHVNIFRHVGVLWRVYLWSCGYVLQLMDKDCYKDIEKIKTIGSTYMAAVGLVPTVGTEVRIFTFLCAFT